MLRNLTFTVNNLLRSIIVSPHAFKYHPINRSYYLNNKHKDREDKLEDHDDDLHYCYQYLPQGVRDIGHSPKNHEIGDGDALYQQEGQHTARAENL
jgi:hypothetical protein